MGGGRVPGTGGGRRATRECVIQSAASGYRNVPGLKS